MVEVMNGMARNFVDVPPPAVWRGGILAAARVIDSTDPHDFLGAEYMSDACVDMNQWNFDPCQMDLGESDKDFDLDPHTVIGDPFTLYTGVECNLQRLDEGLARAIARFNYGERKGVDEAVVFAIANMATAIPGGPLTVPNAIGELENAMALVYGGQPTLVIGMDMMGCACQMGMVSRRADGYLETCNGSTVANVVNSAATPETMYATGQITLLRGPMLTNSTPQQPLGDGTYAPPRAIAERMYVPLIECLALRVEVTCP